VSTIDALRARMPQLRLYDAYGLTETHSPATILLDAEFRRKRGSVGRPVETADVRVVDDEGVDVVTGAAGELLIQGPMVTSGYFGDPGATAAAIRDGWLHTGDYARLDDEGYVYILDRKKDMITRGGFKIYSVEMEYLLVSHPAVREAAVFGVPDPLAFEAVAAYLVPADGARIDVSDIQQWVAARMADYAVPRFVRVVDALPRNRTGKIEKDTLRQQLQDELSDKRKALR
jgi:acyl-CoA synthetase (AMP-forming)/AMP-acid ligase II